MRANYQRAQTNPTEFEEKFGLTESYKDPAEQEAALELETRITLAHCAYMAPFWAFMHDRHPEDVEKMRNNALFDLLQEWRFILGLLAAINSRNVISYSDPITYEKLNKQRAKKGVPPLHEHREVRLSFSRVQRNRIGSDNPIDIQAHPVRGHWKLRSTGLFWWSPFIRGTGPVRHKPYLVRG